MASIAAPPVAPANAPPPVAPPEERAALHTSNRAVLTIGVMAATVMQILDATIANVALPHVRASLGATDDTVTWVLTSYIIATAVAIPLTGWLSDRLGSRTLFLGSVAGFVIASVLCGLSTDMAEIVVFRVFQGVAAAFMNPLSQTVLLDINPRSKQPAAMAIWGQGIMVGPVLGPVIGGWLTDSYSWRWCFYVNVPVGLACFAVLWAYLPSRPKVARRFDLFGFAMLAIAVSAFQLMLDRGQVNDWFDSWEVRIEGLVALAAAWIFGVHLATGRNTIFDRSLFRDQNLLTGIVFLMLVGLLMTATLALLPPMMQSLFGYPVLTTGLTLMPRGVGVIASMTVAARLMARGTDPRLLVACGLAIVAASMWRMTAWTLDMGQASFLVTGLIQGAGLGLIFIPLNLMAFATLRQDQRTEGVSMVNLARSLGGSVGISTLTVLLARNVQTNHEELGGHLHALGLGGADPVVTSMTGATTSQLIGMADALVNQQSAMIAYLDDFRMMMILTLCILPLVLLLKPPRGAPAMADPDVIGH